MCGAVILILGTASTVPIHTRLHAAGTQGGRGVGHTRLWHNELGAVGLAHRAVFLVPMLSSSSQLHIFSTGSPAYSGQTKRQSRPFLMASTMQHRQHGINDFTLRQMSEHEISTAVHYCIGFSPCLLFSCTVLLNATASLRSRTKVGIVKKSV